MPFKRELYPKNWKAISLAIRERDGWRCAWCGAKNREPHPVTGSTVVLTVAHLGTPKPDGTPGNKRDKMDVRPENLAALCQRCHLNFDRDEHIANAAETRRRRKIKAGQMVLPFTD
ncbi:MAG: hypothetical protein Kow0031_08070 [Anaerolineae bacterium]